MEPLEIEESKELSEGAPLDPSASKKLPLGILTKGMKPSVLKRRAQILIVAFPIIFFALSIVFSGYQIYWTHVFNKSHPYTVISQILYRLQDVNCNFPMITDIKVIDADQDCPQNYRNNEDVGIWNGTVEGCYYPSSGTINLQPCPMANENYIRPRNPSPLFIWKKNKFCTKISPNYAFLTAPENSQSKGKRCAAEPLDFSALEGDDCPISDIKILPMGSIVPKGYKWHRLNDDRRLIFKNDPDSTRRLVDLNSELSTYPCYNPAVSPIRFMHGQPYPLSKKKEEGCGEYGYDTESVELLDDIDPMKLYEENGLESVQRDLPLWSIMNKDEKIVLFAKFRDGILSDSSCNFCDRKLTLDKSAKELTVSGKYLNAYVIVTAVVLIFQFFLIAYNLVKYVEYESNYVGLFNDVIYINALFYFSNLCYFAVHGLIAYSDYSQLKGATERVRKIEELNCFKSESLNRVFDDLRGKIIDNSKDIMEDCFKAEIIAILCAGIFLLASYVNKQVIDREKEAAEAQRARHEQTNVPRGDYGSHNVSKAIPEQNISTVDTTRVTAGDEPSRQGPAQDEKKDEEDKAGKETTVLDL